MRVVKHVILINNRKEFGAIADNRSSLISSGLQSARVLHYCVRHHGATLDAQINGFNFTSKINSLDPSEMLLIDLNGLTAFLTLIWLYVDFDCIVAVQVIHIRHWDVMSSNRQKKISINKIFYILLHWRFIDARRVVKKQQKGSVDCLERGLLPRMNCNGLIMIGGHLLITVTAYGNLQLKSH